MRFRLGRNSAITCSLVIEKSGSVRGRAIVGMLDQAGKRIAWVAGIDPVAIGQLAVKRENEALRAICLPPIVTLAIVLGERGNQATGEAGGQSGNDLIKAPGAF